ncbi:MAG TPA: hypothetical protein VME46_12555 [Acidimicrobiales bacterium]|nr:hypothetical protein [Acidimicrobiales bacterium]
MVDVSGADLFVANAFSVSAGALARVIWGPGYQFAGAGAVALSGDNLFVANAGGSVSEIPV